MSAAERPLVGILVGSDSDRERMQPALDELAGRGISHELEVRSAHRNPDAVAEYSRSAREHGIRVLIAGAGLAAGGGGTGADGAVVDVDGAGADGVGTAAVGSGCSKNRSAGAEPRSVEGR